MVLFHSNLFSQDTGSLTQCTACITSKWQILFIEQTQLNSWSQNVSNLSDLNLTLSDLNTHLQFGFLWFKNSDFSISTLLGTVRKHLLVGPYAKREAPKSFHPPKWGRGLDQNDHKFYKKTRVYIIFLEVTPIILCQKTSVNKCLWMVPYITYVVKSWLFLNWDVQSLPQFFGTSLKPAIQAYTQKQMHTALIG